MKATKQSDCWIFDADNEPLFMSDDMDDDTARKVLSALNSHEDLLKIAQRLVAAAEKYKTYDFALSPESVLALAKDAERALRRAKVYSDVEITLTVGRG